MTDFEKSVIDFLKTEDYSDLFWSGNFYEVCCDSLGLVFGEIKPNTKRIQRKLRAMVNKGLINSKRVGTGYGGKELYGCSSTNTYFLNKDDE